LSTEIYGLPSSLCGNQKTALLFGPLDTGLVEGQKNITNIYQTGIIRRTVTSGQNHWLIFDRLVAKQIFNSTFLYIQLY
jgi:hypothetical protein